MRTFAVLAVILVVSACCCLGGNLFQRQNRTNQVVTVEVATERSATEETASEEATLPAQAGQIGNHFSNDAFEFDTPAGWKVTNGPIATGKTADDYMHLGLKIQVQVNEPRHVPLVTIATGEMLVDTYLEDEFNRTYEMIQSEIRNVKDDTLLLDGQDAMVKIYDRPWGEPWYHFEDIWLEVDGQVYVIACQTQLQPTDADLKNIDVILNSLRFK